MELLPSGKRAIKARGVAAPKGWSTLNVRAVFACGLAKML
jgi:hypothetical protein